MDDRADPGGAASEILAQGALEELERVRVLEPIVTAAGTIAAGSAGTIVAVWGGGKRYDVEFTEPFAALVTLLPSQLRLAAAA